MKISGQTDFVVKDLVLVGGGHSHVQVLKRLAMSPVAGLRVTLISREVHTPYSGMLPGYIAGHFGWDDIHIDLAPLCAAAGARLVADSVRGIDLEKNLLSFSDRSPVRFDWLSINSGSAPSISGIQGADRVGIPVKPISRFLPFWDALLDRLRSSDAEKFRIAIVGAGAGGVELALSMHYRLNEVERFSDIDIFLVTADRQLMFSHNDAVQTHLRNELGRKGIALHRGVRVVSAEPGLLRTDTAETFAADEVLWVTQAAPQKWIAESGLTVDAAGFIRVNEHLQSISHPHVFAAGDVIEIDGFPRPKSGVFAVRQGPVLFENLRRAVTRKPLKAFHPQERFLSLISTGDRRAVASRGGFAVSGRWVWYWKYLIDRRFMARFQDIKMPMQARRNRWRVPTEGRESPTPDAMRCGGCGSKLGGDMLARVLGRLKISAPAEMVAGIGDDAAVLRPVVNALQVQTIDGFRAMIDDPYLLGRIAAEHSINDVYAMGGVPRTALAWASVPYAEEHIMEDDFFQLMSGAIDVFDLAGASLVGGHSGESVETTIGFAVTGTVDERDVWQKHRMSIGDCLVLTKPVGTGTLLAAHGQARCRARWLVGALEDMQHSNKDALPVFHECGVRACTDITGFGLLGHIGEMARAAKLSVRIWPSAVPALPGARATLRSGIFSSLQSVNERAMAGIDPRSLDPASANVRLLFDPQTSGGLVASVRPENLERCIAGLRAAGYSVATVIGQVRGAREDGYWGELAELAEEVGVEPTERS
jgi:selenide,water dikinase